MNRRHSEFCPFPGWRNDDSWLHHCSGRLWICCLDEWRSSWNARRKAPSDPLQNGIFLRIRRPVMFLPLVQRRKFTRNKADAVAKNDHIGMRRKTMYSIREMSKRWDANNQSINQLIRSCEDRVDEPSKSINQSTVCLDANVYFMFKQSLTSIVQSFSMHRQNWIDIFTA